MQSRYILHNNRTQLQHSVLWEGSDESEVRWIVAEELSSRDIPFSLEDKASVPRGRGVDTNTESGEQVVEYASSEEHAIEVEVELVEIDNTEAQLRCSTREWVHPKWLKSYQLY